MKSYQAIAEVIKVAKETLGSGMVISVSITACGGDIHKDELSSASIWITIINDYKGQIKKEYNVRDIGDGNIDVKPWKGFWR